ncbi:helix-turn-helix domain-containing protein [Verticiella sediminum]|uniref:Helix-turn-helix domain-containing protein n=1 Tax=Verticiella sediminum TaxID=1247510 RepID=A0A556AUX1_9BURK|nr:helix-turn-helix domain-containing protein [Verticiella sediminum]TSH96749.1 helix-turn-helix domain-containing protein [Verticiella sediminum]
MEREDTLDSAPQHASSRNERAGKAGDGPQPHRTVDRVTQILEEVVYHPGMTFSELARALGAAKSSVHGFIRGLLAKGWLYESDHRFYLGPAVYGLTLASGHIRAGTVDHADLAELHRETSLAVFLGVRAGDHLIYVAEVGSDDAQGFEARSNIRRTLLSTAGGKALLATLSSVERERYLRRRSREEAELVEAFIVDLERIRTSRIATNMNPNGMRFGIATAVRNRQGDAVASVTLVGPRRDVEPNVEALGDALLRHVGRWAQRSLVARERI